MIYDCDTCFAIIDNVAFLRHCIVGQSLNDSAGAKKPETIDEILTGLNSNQINPAKRLQLLNAFVKAINAPKSKDLQTYTTEEILIW